MAKAKILVVDDDKNNQLVYQRILEDIDIEIIQAFSGHEALAVAHKHEFFLILMDVQMPGMDGYEAATQIKLFSDVSIVALTASVMNDDFEREKRDSFDGYLRKPILQIDLINELKKHLENS